MIDIESMGIPIILSLAIGGLGVFFFKSLSSQKWFSHHIVCFTPKFQTMNVDITLS